MSTTPPPILPLPPSVISRLRSTVTIPSLTTAVSELIQNSLDASSTQLTLTVNPSRPSFTLTDNGHGIHPEQLSSVGTLYTTSKYPPSERYFGFRGEALAALAQNSILTVTSRATGWRGSRQCRWSYGKRVFEGVAPDYASLVEAGTTVRVEGLWGNMPVRLKVREDMDMVREWREILKIIAGLLMSGRGKDVGAVVRDENGARRLTIKAQNGERREPWDLTVLRQGFGSDVVGDIGTWESVKARQNGVRIEGWICSKGSGSKSVQFLCVNGFPLASGETELHREVNRIFANSGFGVVEEVDGRGIPKKGGTRKGVDRRGMYVLRIECRGSDLSVIGGEGGTEGKAGVVGDNLKSVIELLQKLVYEFLKTHHYKPSAIGSISANKDIKPPTTIPELFGRMEKEARPPSDSPVTTPLDGALFSHTKARMMDLENWSRVKAARRDATEEEGRCTISGPKKLVLANPPISTHLSTDSSDETTSNQSEEPSEVVNWTNPDSGKSYQVNTRTGNTAAIPQAPIAGTKRSHSATLSDRRISVLAKRPKSALSSPSEPGEFVQQLLAKWKNPVFELAKPAIPAIPHDLTTTENCHSLNATPFTAATSVRVGKLTKSGLQKANVISQVDNKFILAKMYGTTDAPMLVMIDQHAASERIRVEELFQELCETRSDEPPDPTQSVKKSLTFSVSARDAALLKRFQTEFEKWGIGYTLSTPPETVTVHTLPRVVKDRCDNEPILAIELLRKHCYDLEENGVQKIADGDTWVEKLWQIPKPLVEMVNSRACRGAVMFNDPLTLKECETLVQRLAQCKWPFMCAHGRVSMSPLMELGPPPPARKEGSSFIEAFGKWKDGGFAGLNKV
ncbi:hypothetical protein BDD12DRAFT_772791 [Trichophaea hybrida]|nr:hypothetical protein BDD12DRAFT_772791 [Trichophaea hybrida]